MATIQKRIGKDGAVSYRVQVRLKGHPTETASFERKTDASKWAQNIESAIREGRHFKTAISKKHTMAHAIDKYHKEVLCHSKNPINQKIYLAYWRDVLGEYSLADISSSLIVKYRNELLGRENKFGRSIGVATANRYTQALGHVLNIAMKEWEWINQNPMVKITKYKEPRGRVRFLSEEERKGLLEACQQSKNPYLYEVVVLALSTGARKMEILGLKWADIDFTRGLIVLHETKNGERRVIPLQGRALDLMRKLFDNRHKDCDLVFPSRKASKTKTGEFIYQPIDIRTAWENTLVKAGIKDFRFHDLRHSAASYLAMNGASLAEIAEVLGHKTLQMVKRYAHLSEAHTSAVVAKMNERIFGDEYSKNQSQ
jgi:integrase